MRKLIAFNLLLIFALAHSQVHRFYYEMVYKPTKDSATTEKEMMVLDVGKDESLFMSYKQLDYDSTLTAGIKKAQEMGADVDAALMSKKPPIFSYRISKLKNGTLRYKDFIGMSEYYVYEEKPNLKWNISSEKEKIGVYNTQKATTEFGERKWTAWFTPEIPIQDGPYKFSGLPGLIVKIEDAGQNYIWTLEANKKLSQNIVTNKQNYLEFQMGEAKKITKDGFVKRLSEYRKNPMGQMSQWFDEKNPELMKRLKEQEKREKEKLAHYNNTVEI
ncbi:GLPGLI family protein [Epilithonimonas zeae]|uniref:GLPGLI family protein n=1 Tax=Epilithonimonas zeae TaxID=1416779 RepID=UPI00200F8B3F|nr:GLPGLI family protein [Epilithonimonas zeae]UQB67908.1 GLPGLI family protein [Epilithonimonas zeae]